MVVMMMMMNATMMKEITMIQQRSPEQRSTFDSKRRLANFKMLVHQCQQS